MVPEWGCFLLLILAWQLEGLVASWQMQWDSEVLLPLLGWHQLSDHQGMERLSMMLQLQLELLNLRRGLGLSPSCSLLPSSRRP